MKVREVCNCNVVYATPDSTVCDCAKLMNQNNIGCLPICDTSKKLVGIVTDRDITLRTLACDKDPAKTPVSDIMTCNVCACQADAKLKDVEEEMCCNGVRRIPVVDKGKVVGILTISDLIKNKNIPDQEITITLEGICNCNNKNDY